MTVKSDRELNRSLLIGALFIGVITGSAYIVGALSNVYFFNNFGKVAIDFVGGNIDSIIPTFISLALPEWFVYIFLLSLLEAAMSTLSAQLHTQGTSLGHDIVEAIKTRKESALEAAKNESSNKNKSSVLITKIGILVGVILAVVLGLILPGSIVALGTSLFMEFVQQHFYLFIQLLCSGRELQKQELLVEFSLELL